MKFKAEVSTDGACFYALFDPASLPTDVDSDSSEMWECKALVGEGKLFRYQESGDGSAAVHVLVDEQPDEDVLRIMQGEVRDSLLRIPTGRLVLAGGEILPAIMGDEQARTQAAHPPTFAGDWTVTPGIYDLWAFSTDPELKESRVHQGLTPAQKIATTIHDWLMTVVSAVGCGSIVVGGFALIPLLMSDSDTALRFAIIAGITFVADIVLGVVVWNVPPLKSAVAAKNNLNLQWPDIVVVLARRTFGDLPPTYNQPCLNWNDNLVDPGKAAKREARKRRWRKSRDS